VRSIKALNIKLIFNGAIRVRLPAGNLGPAVDDKSNTNKANFKRTHKGVWGSRLNFIFLGNHDVTQIWEITIRHELSRCL
jgi:hypothetical protein